MWKNNRSMRIFLAATNRGKVTQKYKPLYILETFYSGEKVCLKAINVVGNENFLLDSGAFSYMNGKQITKEEMELYIKRYISFINTYDIKYFFEVDVDPIFGLPQVELWTKKIEKETGKKCIPVWHKERGVEYWKKLCNTYDYIAIGGLVLNAKKSEYPLYQKLVEYAYNKGVKVHGLGFTKTKILPEYKFYSVDSSSWVTAAARGKQIYFFNGKVIKGRKIESNGRRLDINKLILHNFSEWIKYQKYMDGVRY